MTTRSIHSLSLLRLTAVCLTAVSLTVGCSSNRQARTTVNIPRSADSDRLSFQAQDAWTPRVNLNADLAMVYGIDKTLPERLQSWREKGYRPQVMTGVAWGEYQDYLYGRWDGIRHLDEVQTESNGHRIGHGGDVYYMSPSESYGRFLCAGVKRALDAGAEAIYLEEPEFWVRGGWSDGFKREWQSYYGEPWAAPDSSPDAQYRASKLKYYLYRRTLSQVFDFVRDYGITHGRKIPCYVPTHSLINYASWGICSPESSLLSVGCDGYIAQVWTGTARTPNSYEGTKKERTFETAFLEYGVMQNLVRASGRKMWFLNDPIEDNPDHSWDDYRTNWESTLIASLLQPEISRYEIMPWPHRIFDGLYPATQPVKAKTPRIPIPPEYEAELQSVITALGDMNQPQASVQWLASGTHGVGVLVSDTLMFQQFGPNSADHDLGHFYGLALPLLMRGMPVEPVQIETADLTPYKVLLLSYEGQKPPSPKLHADLVKWVHAGGALVVVDDDKDPFRNVREWWNTGDLHFETPRHHLFSQLGLAPDATGLDHVGRGTVCYLPESPTRLSRDQRGADVVRQAASSSMKAVGLPWTESSALVLRRGPYIVCAGLEKAVPGASAFSLQGHFISLFDPNLATVTTVHIKPADRMLLLDLDAIRSTGVIAAACRITNEQRVSTSIGFTADGVEGSPGVICLRLVHRPSSVLIDDQECPAPKLDWNAGLLRIRFSNRASGHTFKVTW